MIKNLILDIGGVILDDSDEIKEKVLQISKQEVSKISKIVYGDKRFISCLLGNLSQEDYMKQLLNENPKYKIEIEKLLKKEYQHKCFPVINETIELLYELKNQNYKIYFLSNLTDDTYYYLKDKLNILDDFDGGVYSCIENMRKPHEDIYKLLIERYKLSKEETIFFDDKLRNIEAGNRLGIKSIQFKDYRTIINSLDLLNKA